MQQHGGVTNYFIELIKNVDGPDHCHVVAPTNEDEHQKIYTCLSEIISIPDFVSPPRARQGILGSIKSLLRPADDTFSRIRDSFVLTINKNRPDVFHPTMYNDYYLDYLDGLPFALTIYDMTHEKFPEYFPGSDLAKTKKKLFRKASQVIAISESTKSDIMSIYGCSGDKITVIHLCGALAGGHIRGVSIPGLPGNFLLYVGVRSGYKNFLFFIESIADILQRDRSLHVVCTGGTFYAAETECLRKFDIENQVHSFKVDNCELQLLYQQARAFVYPSLNEGFGIPVLEAFSYGCPALLSNRSSLPEVGGAAALYFDPEDSSAIADCVQTVLGDSEKRDELIKAGYEQMKLFSWQKTARKTRAVYEKCLTA